MTAIANSSGVYSVNLPVRQIEGQSLSATATDAAGNTSSPTSVIAPVLPLLAEDNITRLPLQTDVTVSTEHKSDYGFLLVNALGNVANVLGTIRQPSILISPLAAADPLRSMQPRPAWSCHC